MDPLNALVLSAPPEWIPYFGDCGDPAKGLDRLVG